MNGKDTVYTVQLTETQMRVVQNALEEYFRLRLGQCSDFCMDLAGMECDLSPDNQKHEVIFGKYMQRRDHLEALMKAFFLIAFEPTGYATEKTEDMLIAECIWDAIRCARGVSRYTFPLKTGSEPAPEIERIRNNE